MNRKNKKAQIPGTITWVVATLLIAFIIALFIFFSASALFFKAAPEYEIFSGEKESYRYAARPTNIQSVKTLTTLLNAPILIDGTNYRLEEAILLWAEAFSDWVNPSRETDSSVDRDRMYEVSGCIEKDITKILDSIYGKESYFFHIKYGPFTVTSNQFPVDTFGYAEIKLGDAGIYSEETYRTYQQSRSAYFIIPFYSNVPQGHKDQHVFGYLYIKENGK